MCSTSDGHNNKPDWIAPLLENEKIAFYGRERIEKLKNILHRVGFSEENVIKIIKGHPDALGLNPKRVAKSLEAWHVCNFSKVQFYELFVQNPEFLEFDEERFIAKRFTQIQEFAYTEKNVWRLFMSSPNILVDDINVTKEKVDYILNDMEVDETDMVKSGALGLAINKIKARHMLLVRMGFFKKRNWKESELSTNKNPRMYRITDFDDKEFASKTCNGLSIKELETFYDLYERELIEAKEEAEEYYRFSDEESDDDSNSDDEDFDARENADFYDNRHKRKYNEKTIKIQKNIEEYQSIIRRSNYQ